MTAPEASPLLPTGEAWQPLASRYATARAVGSLLTNLPIAAVLTAAAFLVPAVPSWLFWAVLAGSVAWAGWRAIRARRWVRNFRYAERGHDLLLHRGLWNRELIAIPYGRMQSVEVSSGPVDRLWGVAGVSIVTASVGSAGTIPGLEAARAAELRDRLIRSGESQALPL